MTGRKIKAMRSDGGGEYISIEYSDHLESNGIQKQLTVPHTPHQNGVVERMNRTSKNLMRAMLLHKNVSKEFLADAVVTAASIRNRVTSRGIPGNSTPYNLWHNKKPNIAHLRVFRSKWWYNHNRPGRRALDSRSSEALITGYALNQKGYKLSDDRKLQVGVSCDVVFSEHPSTNAVIGDTDHPD